MWRKPTPKNEPEIPKLSEMEWDVIKPLWDKGPLPAREIIQSIPPERNWASKTVKTMLARLVKKGAISYVGIKNHYLYEANFTREQITQAATRSFIERVFDGGLRPFLAHFAEGATSEEIAVIRTELARLHRKDKP